MTDDDSRAALGRRDRKKAQTRKAIGDAALRLALELGPENVRVEDIAAAADVSTRTFNNYFSSREEAIWAPRLETSLRLSEALRARPPQEPLDEALRAAALEVSVKVEAEEDLIRRIAADSAMREEYMRGILRAEESLAQVIAERTGTDLDTDLVPRVIAASYSTALRIASQYWLRADDAPLGEFLHPALDQVAPVARHRAGAKPC